MTFNAVDAVNGNYFVNNGEEYLIVKNDDATATVTVTIHSVPCSHGRTGDIIATVNVGEQKVFGPFPRELFNQRRARNVHVDFSSGTNVSAAVIKP